MDLIFIVLTGVLMGAFNLGFFLVGYHFGSKNTVEEGVTVTKENQEFIKELMAWRNYEN